MRQQAVRALALLGAMTLLSCATARAEVPDTIGYQGVLRDAGGAVITGAVDLTFRIYDTPSGGTELWSETHERVLPDDGRFSIRLGSVVPFDLDFDRAYFVEVQVDADPPMAPRQELAATPYAIRSRIANRFASVFDGVGNDLGAFAGASSFVQRTVLSTKGYLFFVDVRDGLVTVPSPVPTYYFPNADCSGDAYLFASEFRGFVFGRSTSYPPPLYYVPVDAQPETVLISSFGSTGDCFGTSFQSSMLPVLPNDPEVTGVASDNPKYLPITVSRGITFAYSYGYGGGYGYGYGEGECDPYSYGYGYGYGYGYDECGQMAAATVPEAVVRIASARLNARILARLDSVAALVR